MDHIPDQQIQDYLTSPAAPEFAELRLHLAACGHCRRRTELTAMLRQQGQWLETEPVESETDLAGLIDGSLDANQAHRLRQELKQDPARLRAALHYASHAQAMQALNTSAETRDSVWTSPLQLLKQWLSFEAPLWQAVPAAAVLLTLIGLLLNQYWPGEQARIVAFEEQTMLRIAVNENQPGIGFFAQSGSRSQAFGAMKIEMPGENRLRLSWPQVDNARGYRLKLQVFREGETRVLARTEVKRPQAELVVNEPLTQHRYEWVLSGDTADDRSFEASGGFVIFRP